jgi:hypothetical protein
VYLRTPPAVSKKSRKLPCKLYDTDLVRSGNIKRVGWFDIHPEDDKVRSVAHILVLKGMHTDILTQAAGGGRVEFVGTWGHYAFPSGYIFVNTIERGGFVVKLSK